MELGDGSADGDGGNGDVCLRFLAGGCLNSVSGSLLTEPTAAGPISGRVTQVIVGTGQLE
jgi:hypothetical protein